MRLLVLGTWSVSHRPCKLLQQHHGPIKAKPHNSPLSFCTLGWRQRGRERKGKASQRLTPKDQSQGSPRQPKTKGFPRPCRKPFRNPSLQLEATMITAKAVMCLLHSVQFSRSVVSNSLQPHGLQHARPPCLSPTPRACSNPCPLSR